MRLLYLCGYGTEQRKVFLMNKADDIIDRIVIDRNAGVAILCKQHRKLFHGDRIWGSDNIHTGVRISSTSMSLNSMAARMSSLSWCSNPPSFSASSTIVISSSSVMPSSSEERKRRIAAFWKRLKNRCSGVSRMRQTFNAGAALIQNFSAWSLARVFGAISPK